MNESMDVCLVGVHDSICVDIYFRACVPVDLCEGNFFFTSLLLLFFVVGFFVVVVFHWGFFFFFFAQRLENVFKSKRALQMLLIIVNRKAKSEYPKLPDTRLYSVHRLLCP